MLKCQKECKQLLGDNRSMPSLYEKTFCLCVKNLITDREYEIAKIVEGNHCNRWHCNTTRMIWDQIITNRKVFRHLNFSAQPMKPSKGWHALVKINEREHLVQRL